MILGESRKNAGMKRLRQLEYPLQKSAHESGNNIRKKKKELDMHMVDVLPMQQLQV
jgi:hypothetical protein